MTDITPFYLIQELASRALESDRLQFEFSTYDPTVSGLSKRAIKRVGAADVNDFYQREIQALEGWQELAIHGWVLSQGSSHFIPMIDFIGQPSVSEILALVNDLLPTDFYLFDSGKSYHGYFLNAEPGCDFSRFMGSLLLLNKDRPIVDARWVGHSLFNGFSALRLSNNSRHSTQEPVLVAKRLVGGY